MRCSSSHGRWTTAWDNSRRFCSRPGCGTVRARRLVPRFATPRDAGSRNSGCVSNCARPVQGLPGKRSRLWGVGPLRASSRGGPQQPTAEPFLLRWPLGGRITSACSSSSSTTGRYDGAGRPERVGEEIAGRVADRPGSFALALLARLRRASAGPRMMFDPARPRSEEPCMTGERGRYVPVTLESAGFLNHADISGKFRRYF